MDGSPSRPADVPEGATWVPEAAEWRHGPVDARGDKQGLHRSWRADGSLREEARFVDGKGVGPYRRFHPDRSIAGEGEFVDGSMQGTVRAYACDAPTPEVLQPCCVPPSAWEMQTDYHRGEIMARRWYNRAGTQILESGAPHPPRPPSVPAEARYDEEAARWWTGSYQVGTGAVMRWRRWSREGVLVEEEDREDGVRHGVWRRFRDNDGGLCFEARFERGVKHGPFYDRTVGGPNDLEPRAADEVGQFEHGQAVGVWTLRDAGGAVLTERDLGVAVTEEALARSPVFADGADASYLASLSGALRVERRGGEAIVAMARSTALSGDVTPLRALLDQVTWPRPATARRELAAAVIDNEGDRLAPLINALVHGGDPAALLRALASAMRGGYRAALQIVDGALTLAPDLVPGLVTRALVNVHLGDADAARADARRLPEEWDEQCRQLLDYVRAIFPTFDFWPARVSVQTVFAEYPTAPAQSLPAIRAAAGKYATRLSEIGAAVARLMTPRGDAGGAPIFLLPDLSALLPQGPVALGTWTFQQTFDAAGADAAAPAGDQTGLVTEEIAIDERLALDGLSIPALLRMARREWAALTWLCWCCGLDRVVLPDTVTPPDEFGPAAGMSIERAWRCRDKLTSGGLVALAKGIPGFEWEGMHIDTMSRALAEVMAEEHIEVRAMFLWLCDDTAQSPWQGDLRDRD